MHVFNGSANRGGAVRQNGNLNGRRQRGLEGRQKRFDAVNDADDVGAGLPLNIEDHRRSVIEPSGLAGVFDAINYVRDVLDADGRAVLISNDDGLVLRAVEDLIVSANGISLPRTIDIALGLVHIGRGQGCTQVFQAQTKGGQGRGIGLHPHSGFLAAADGHQADSRELRNLLRQRGIGQVLHLLQRHGVAAQRQSQDWGVGRIHFAVNGRIRQVRGKKRASGIDGGLHLLFSNIDVLLEIELQRDQ